MYSLRAAVSSSIAVVLLTAATGAPVGGSEETANLELVPTEDPAVLQAAFQPTEEWMDEPRQLAFGPDGSLWVWDGLDLWQAGVPDGPATARTFDTVHDLAVSLDGTLWVADRTGLWSLAKGRWTRDWQGAVYALEIAPDGTLLAVGGGMRGEPEHDDFSLIRIDSRTRSATPIEGLPAVDWPSGLVAPRDGGVWVAALKPDWGFVGLVFDEGLLLRHDGATWQGIDALGDSPVQGVPALAVGPDGSLWVLSRVLDENGASEPRLARLQGSEWTASSAADGVPLDVGMRVGSLAVDAAGRVWSAPGEQEDAQGIYAFDGEKWDRYLPGAFISDIIIGPEGSLWTAGSGGIHVIRPEAAATAE
jgi:hypothetical protein